MSAINFTSSPPQKMYFGMAFSKDVNQRLETNVLHKALKSFRKDPSAKNLIRLTEVFSTGTQENKTQVSQQQDSFFYVCPLPLMLKTFKGYSIYQQQEVLDGLKESDVMVNDALANRYLDIYEENCKQALQALAPSKIA